MHMEKSILFSVLSLVAVQIYLSIGIYTFKQNTKSLVHKCFLLLCLSYSVWSFAYSFVYSSSNEYLMSFWNKVSAFGWCTFSALSLYLVLLITENKIIKNRVVTILIFSPAVMFLYMVLFLFGVDIETPEIINRIFYIGNFLYNYLFLLLSIIILFVWGLKNSSKRIKIQANILVLSSLIPYCLNLLTQTILPRFGIEGFPKMGQLYSIILILGVYMVIIKYKFLKLPEKVFFEEVENKLMDMLIYLNDKFEIVRISEHTLNLLGYEEKDLLYKNITLLFNEEVKEQTKNGTVKNEKSTYHDIQIAKKHGEVLPTNVTFLPVFDDKIHDFLGAVLIIQDISTEYELRRKNEMLHEKTIRDSLTSLYNHQYSIQVLKSEIEKLNSHDPKKELSLAMLDIDYFKRVNDTYGHVFGDSVLETVSTIIVNNINDRGYAGRFGGEEFIMIFPEMDLNKSLAICDKIRKEIELYKFENNLRLSVSIGIKQFQNESTVEFIKNADDLLYKAKANGRNRIEFI